MLRRLDKALTRVGDLSSACFELLFEIGAGFVSSTDARLRSSQMKLATSRSALRPFARQRHPHRGLVPSWSSQSGTGPTGRIARSRERAWARNGAMLDAACRLAAWQSREVCHHAAGASSFVRSLVGHPALRAIGPTMARSASRGVVPGIVCPRGHDIQGRLMGVGAAAVRRCASRATAVQPAMFLVMETPR